MSVTAEVFIIASERYITAMDGGRKFLNKQKSFLKGRFCNPLFLHEKHQYDLAKKDHLALTSKSATTAVTLSKLQLQKKGFYRWCW